MTVSLIIVHIWVFLSLALLCGAVYVALSGERALVWMGAGLVCAGVELAFVVGDNGQWIEMAAVTILVPAGYLCLGQAFRIILGQRRRYHGLLAIISALVIVDIVLPLAGMPALYQKLLFEIACALAVSESLVRMWRAPRRKPADVALIAVLALIVSVYLLRIPAFLARFDTGTSLAQLQNDPLTQSLLLAEAMLVVIGVFLLLARIIGQVIARYRSVSERDDLTGLLNRRAFGDRAAADDRGGALILCDLDHFKAVNDLYGHPIGDAVLRDFAMRLIRTGYDAGRLGGEEFAVRLPGESIADATRLAERVRADYHAHAHPGTAPDHRLSASFGIARHAPGEPLAAALSRADAALYAAKEAGRNRVAISVNAGCGATTKPEVMRLQHAA